MAGWVSHPTWSFVKSPLALVDVSVKGSMTFDVNGFALDKRQVSPEGADADPLAPVSLLVFSPGIYSVSVDTPISATRGVAVLSDSPMANVPVDLQAFATPEFVDIVQQRVEEFLTACATQEVLQPTACPFGFVVQDRIVSPPTWSIAVAAQRLGRARRRGMADPGRRGDRSHRGRHPLALRRIRERCRRGRAVHRHRLDHGAAGRNRFDHRRGLRPAVTSLRAGV